MSKKSIIKKLKQKHKIIKIIMNSMSREKNAMLVLMRTIWINLILTMEMVMI